MPKRRGNSFYRDKRDLSKFAVTLCGAPITEKFRAAGHPVCAACIAKQDELQAAVIAALPTEPRW
jgi:hypothetical protein